MKRPGRGTGAMNSSAIKLLIMKLPIRKFLIGSLLIVLAQVFTDATGFSREVGASGASEKTPLARRVLIVSVPALTWQQVVDEQPPTLISLFRRAAVASMSVRTLGRITSLAEGYATIGAGNRATAPESSAGLAFPSSARVESNEADIVAALRCGCSVGGDIVHLGATQAHEANDRLLYGAEAGALGDALTRAGRHAAVITNGDETFETPGAPLNLSQSQWVHREAALAVMDAAGSVYGGSVGQDLIRMNVDAPFGVSADEDATADAVERAWRHSDVVLVELSELARADRYRPLVMPKAYPSLQAAALSRSDALLAMILSRIDLNFSRDLVLIVAPNAPSSAPVQLTVSALVGPGFKPGLATSATTNRDGYLSLPDLAPTVLDALGVEAPDSMTGTIVSAAGSVAPDQDLFKKLAANNARSVFRDKATGPVSVAFIVFQVLVYGMAMLALTRRPSLRPLVLSCALVILAIAPLTFLSGLVRYDSLGVGGYLPALFAAAAVLAGLVAGLVRLTTRWLGAAAPMAAPLGLVALSLAVMLIDAFRGTRLQIDTVFGYSPIVAGRFAGYGNVAFALVGMSAIVLATGAWGMVALRAGQSTPPSRRMLLGGLGSFLAVVLVTDGHPGLGADVGGILAAAPAFILTMLLLAGARISWRRLVVMGFAAVAVVGVFAAIDLARPESSRTHLGRSVARVLDGGDVSTVLLRKASTNLSILTSSVWTLVIPVAVAFLVFLVLRSDGLLSDFQRRVPGLRACLAGGLAVGVIGFALNDSGVAVPAVMLAVLLPYITYLMVGMTERR